MKVLSIDHLPRKNSVQHHTDDFYCMQEKETQQLVTRRGQMFDILLNLNRPYNEDTDGIRLIFEFGKGAAI